MRQGTDLAELVDPELSAALVLANAQLGEARAARDRVYAGGRVERVAKLRIRAPSDGTVALLVAGPGEAVIPGQLVMTLEASGRNWASFNLREDQFDALRIGSPVDLVAVDGKNRIHARITEILVRGEFTTWRAARVVGDHDLKTFLVRAEPVALQPGMSIWLEPVEQTGHR